jgi:hypothetical protein
MLIDVAKKDIQATNTSVLAEQMFDASTAKGLVEVAYLESQGFHEAAFRRLQQVEMAAPGGGFCGAGSCGLERVDASSDAGKDLMKKVDAKAGDTVLKDTERSCKCGNKTIVYAFSKNKVNKYCESCGSFESKAGKAA